MSGVRDPGGSHPFPPHTSVSKSAWVGVAVGCAVVLALRALWWEFAGPVNGDIAWGLTIADQMAAGRVLYRDILEVNPPLIFWGFGVARWLAGMLSISPENANRLLTLILLLGCFLATLAIGRSWRWGPLLSVVLIGLIGRDFGQREHLVVALLLPFVIRPASLPRWADIAVGCAAGLALSIKPFYAAIWVGLMLNRRPNRADAAVLLTGLAYLLTVAFWAPGFLDVAHRYGPVYALFDHHPAVELLTRPETLLATAVASAAYAAGERRLAIAAFGGLIGLLLQEKGWAYHSYPLIAFALLAAGMAVGAGRRLLPAILAIALIVGGDSYPAKRLTSPGVRMGRYEYSARRALTSVRPGERVLVLSTLVGDGSIRIRERGGVDIGSVPSIWWVRALRDSTRTPGPMEDAELRAFELVVQDIQRAPDVIAIESPDVSARRVAPGFSLLTYLSDPRVRRELANYQPPLDSAAYYWVYRRR